MKKIINVLMFFVITATLLGFILKQNTTSSPKIFVGYINNIPVFDAYGEKTLYRYEDEFKVLLKYSQNYNLKAFCEGFVCYEEKTKTGFNMVISKEQQEKKYPLSNKLSYVAIDERGAVYYTDNNSQSIKSIKNNEAKDIGIKGYVLNVVNGCLYYSKEHDPNLSYANADIFELDLSLEVTALPKKIITNVSGEATVILPVGRYVYDQKLINGGFKPVLYGTDGKEYKNLEIDSKYLNTTPFYSYQKNALIFYDINTMEMKEVRVPTH